MSKLSAIRSIKAASIATASLSVETSGEGFFEITPEVTRFLKQVSAGDGALLIYLRHTSASLVIQENVDPEMALYRSLHFCSLHPQMRMWSNLVRRIR